MNKNINTTWIILVISLSLIVSCEYVLNIKGYVKSNNTKKPLKGVKVVISKRDIMVETDSNGFFDIYNFGEKIEPHIVIIKQNYKSFDMDLTSSSRTRSYIVNDESIFYKYEEPYYPEPNNKKTYTLGTWVQRFSQNFSINKDTITFYLDTIDINAEIEYSKKSFISPH